MVVFEKLTGGIKETRRTFPLTKLRRKVSRKKAVEPVEVVLGGFPVFGLGTDGLLRAITRRPRH